MYILSQTKNISMGGASREGTTETKSKDKWQPQEKMCKSCHRHKAIFNI